MKNSGETSSVGTANSQLCQIFCSEFLSFFNKMTVKCVDVSCTGRGFSGLIHKKTHAVKSESPNITMN